MRKHLPSITLNVVVPFLIYTIARPHMSSDFLALALASSFSAVYTLAVFAVRRKWDPVGAIAVVTYVVVLTIALLSGGNEFVLKVNDVFITGPIGLAFLVSVLVGRPLHLVIHEFIAKRRGVEVHVRNRRASVITSLLIGAVLTVHAVVVILLAVSLTTPEFVALSRPVGLSIIAVGVLAILGYRRVISARVAQQSQR
ncbi:VC0807 family protein [Kibdelosporangium lantanae]|uniref:VC0807 family protein n=1 Tax=Kibdelosporangium lantanae TaxID=1497396 RepID=A0ABW3M337_9PSEU